MTTSVLDVGVATLAEIGGYVACWTWLQLHRSP
jgi:drug/metabolite transporter superfamily protein YnfA